MYGRLLYHIGYMDTSFTSPHVTLSMPLVTDGLNQGIFLMSRGSFMVYVSTEVFLCGASHYTISPSCIRRRPGGRTPLNARWCAPSLLSAAQDHFSISMGSRDRLSGRASSGVLYLPRPLVVSASGFHRPRSHRVQVKERSKITPISHPSDCCRLFGGVAYIP